jgi:hypothetical protein
MRHTRQGRTWWNFWLPLLLLFLLGGMLVLEPQAPIPPVGHQVMQLAISLLMYSLVACWLWCNRGALVLQEQEREKVQEREHRARQQGQTFARSDYETWDDAWPPWHSNGHDTDMQRRQ